MTELCTATTLSDVPKNAAIVDDSQYSRTTTIESASHYEYDEYNRRAAVYRDEKDTSSRQRRPQLAVDDMPMDTIRNSGKARSAEA